MDSARRPLFILNPTAGGGRARGAQSLVWEALRAHGGGELVLTRGPWHAADLAEQGARDGFWPIVGVGGDGTLSEVANGLMRVADPPPLAAVPLGTGNDYVRSMGLPREAVDALRLVWEGPERRIDLAQCGDRYFLNAGGVGFDAQCARTAAAVPRMLRIGTLPYVAAVLGEVVRNRKQNLVVQLDDGALELRSLMVSVANGPYYGGGMRICPGASRSDGLLDVCVVGDATRRDVLQLLPKIFSGGHVGHPRVAMHQARVVRVGGPDDCYVQVDGDLVGPLPAEFTAVPSALPVIVPPLG